MTLAGETTVPEWARLDEEHQEDIDRMLQRVARSVSTLSWRLRGTSSTPVIAFTAMVGSLIALARLAAALGDSPVGWRPLVCSRRPP